MSVNGVFSMWTGNGANLLVFVCISTFVSTGFISIAATKDIHKHTIHAKLVAIVGMRLREVLYRILFAMVWEKVGGLGDLVSKAIVVSVFVSGAYFSISRYGRIECQPYIAYRFN